MTDATCGCAPHSVLLVEHHTILTPRASKPDVVVDSIEAIAGDAWSQSRVQANLFAVHRNINLATRRGQPRT